jgi:SPP1 family predicted phage head-tail adaptor
VSARATIGDLRHRVTIESAVDAPDEAGGMVRAYAPLASVWARIESDGAREQFVEQRLEQSRMHIVTIRWREDVNSQMRFDFKGRKLMIRSVEDEDESRWRLKCRCEEVS